MYNVIAILMLFLSWLSFPLESYAYTVVKNNPEEIIRQDLQQFFTMTKLFLGDDQPVTLIVFPVESFIFDQFAERVLGMKSGIVNRFWEIQRAKGLALYPTIVLDNDDMLEKVKQIPGAIGFLYNKQLDVFEIIYVEDIVRNE